MNLSTIDIESFDFEKYYEWRQDVDHIEAKYFEQFEGIYDSTVRFSFRKFGLKYTELDIDILMERIKNFPLSMMSRDRIDDMVYEYIAEQEDLFGREFECAE